MSTLKFAIFYAALLVEALSFVIEFLMCSTIMSFWQAIWLVNW